MFFYSMDKLARRLHLGGGFFIASPAKGRRTVERAPKAKKAVFLPVVAGLAFCLLVGCGGGGGDITGAHIGTGLPGGDENARQLTDLPARPGPPEDRRDVELALLNPARPPDAGRGLLNERNLYQIQAPFAWFRCPDGLLECSIAGPGIVVGIMEEVNHFHESFLLDNPDVTGEVVYPQTKVHLASVFGSPYPTNAPAPAENLIVNWEDFTVNRGGEYPEYPCLLEYGIPCPVQDGTQKYFLRLDASRGGGLQVLPGKNNTIESIECYNERGQPNLGNPRCRFDSQGNLRVIFVQGVCPVFNGSYACPEFGASHGTGVAGTAVSRALTLGMRNETGFRGVAYHATLLVYARPLRIAGLPASFADHARYLLDAPAAADVYNFSHTFGTQVQGTSGAFADRVRSPRSGFSQLAVALRCLGTSQTSSCSNEEATPFIAASGNDGEAFPRFPAALPVFFDYLRGQVLAVTATDNDGVIAPYANRCGALPSDWNRNTQGRHYCLAAPGGANVSPIGQNRFWVSGPAEGVYSPVLGTSFASPVVAGGFAVVKEHFRDDDGMDTMSDRELLLRLVNTANNTNCAREANRNENGPCDVWGAGILMGDYSNEAVYGAGLLDLNAATAPVGMQRMSAFGGVNGGITYDFDVTSLTTSAAFGDALQRALHAQKIAVFDELNAPFWYPLATLMTTTASRETLQERHARLFDRDNAPIETAFGGRLALTSTHTGSSEQIDMSLRQPVDSIAQTELLLTAGDLSTAPLGLHDDKSFAHPYLHFAGEGVGLGGSLQLGAGRLTAMGFTSGSASVPEDIPVEAHGGMVEYALEPLEGVALGVQAGAMVEGSRALGLLPEGGFGALGESSTAFAGVSLDGSLEDGWRFRASMLFGRTNLDTPSIGLLATSSSLESSAFRFAFEGSDVLLDADRVDVFVAQPLRIEGGDADFIVPVSRTPSGLVTRERISGVSLEPGGRELEFGTRYEMQVREDIVATGGVGIVHEGGHSKWQETELYGLANLRIEF
ncbi:MAG: S8 family serine peptidase [Hyphomicrobiales bacterium]|nr:S8 family serine peptidase [Hyphomicrobiales bacterium]